MGVPVHGDIHRSARNLMDFVPAGPSMLHVIAAACVGVNIAFAIAEIAFSRR